MSDEPELTPLERAVLSARERNALLTAEASAYALRDAGFDPSSAWGKVALKQYRGEPEPDAIRQFIADEFGVGPDGKPVDTEGTDHA